MPAPRGFLNKLVAVNGAIATVLFGALTVIVSLQVLTRFVLHMPFIWSEELARFLFFWVVLLGAAMSVKNRRHFVIDVTMGRVDTWSPTLRFGFSAIPHLCILAFAALLFVQGIGYTKIGLLRTATNSRLNMALVYAAIPTFAALTFIYALGNLLLDYRTHVRGRAPEPLEPPMAE
ncbi:MAG: TRAP transporter small permease [Gemmatimonadota bacterium]